MFYYSKDEELPIDESINNYENIFNDYNGKSPTLEEALNELFISSGLPKDEVSNFSKKVINKSKEIINSNFDQIKKNHPLLLKEEAYIISSYTYYDNKPNYNPYEIVNNNLCKEKRIEGIKNISKYFYLFLKALRNLNRYYPKQKYLYRCINKKVSLKKDFFNEKLIPYESKRIKIFWGFISVSRSEKYTYNLNNEEKEIKTVFSLFGDIWGYDISLFNEFKNEHIILEPEMKGLILDAIPPNKKSKNDIVHIRCQIEKPKMILKNIIREKLFRLTYLRPNDDKSNKIRIFGKEFVENNKNICKISYEGEIHKLNEFIDISNSKSNVTVFLFGIEEVKSMRKMFLDTSLLRFDITPDLIINNITDLSHMFNGCTSLTCLPDISNWDTSNVTDMNSMFYRCEILESLPDISKWNTSNTVDMSNLFFGCQSLKALPDISKWNLNKVLDISCMFENINLESLPDISKWDTSKVKNMSSLFNNCRKLLSLPDISNWKTDNVSNMEKMFAGCEKISSLPDISNWNTSNVINMYFLFGSCLKLKSLPDISKWKTPKLENVEKMFYFCSSLESIPNIFEWDTSKIISMAYMFFDCSEIKSMDYKCSWNTQNLMEMKFMFYKCEKLLVLPDISNINTSKVISINEIFSKCYE